MKDQGRKNAREKIVDLVPTLTRSTKRDPTLLSECGRTRKRKALDTLLSLRVEVMMIIIFDD